MKKEIQLEYGIDDVICTVCGGDIMGSRKGRLGMLLVGLLGVFLFFTHDSYANEYVIGRGYFLQVNGIEYSYCCNGDHSCTSPCGCDTCPAGPWIVGNNHVNIANQFTIYHPFPGVTNVAFFSGGILVYQGDQPVKIPLGTEYIPLPCPPK